jgi:hypothetical protein
MGFQTEMDNANNIMPNIVTPELESISLSSMMIRVSIKDYEPNASDSPAQSVADSEGSGSVTSLLTELPENDPLSEYQSLEKPSRIVGSFKMHLVAKKKSTETKKVSDQGDNLMAGSWKMHQCFDGMKTLRGIPLVTIDPSQNQPNEEKTDKWGRKRRRVDLDVEFYDAETNAEMQVVFKEGVARIEGEEFKWRAWVWVEDAQTFIRNLKLKSDETRQTWTELDNM